MKPVTPSVVMPLISLPSSADFEKFIGEGKNNQVLTFRNNKFEWVDREKNHAEQKIFKKIAYFFSGNKKAEINLKKELAPLEKDFPNLRKLIFHVRSSEAKTGLGGRKYLDNHAQIIQQELSSNEIFAKISNIKKIMPDESSRKLVKNFFQSVKYSPAFGKNPHKISQDIFDTMKKYVDGIDLEKKDVKNIINFENFLLGDNRPEEMTDEVASDFQQIVDQIKQLREEKDAKLRAIDKNYSQQEVIIISQAINGLF